MARGFFWGLVSGSTASLGVLMGIAAVTDPPRAPVVSTDLAEAPPVPPGRANLSGRMPGRVGDDLPAPATPRAPAPEVPSKADVAAGIATTSAPPVAPLQVSASLPVDTVSEVRAEGSPRVRDDELRPARFPATPLPRQDAGSDAPSLPDDPADRASATFDATGPAMAIAPRADLSGLAAIDSADARPGTVTAGRVNSAFVPVGPAFTFGEPEKPSATGAAPQRTVLAVPERSALLSGDPVTDAPPSRAMRSLKEAALPHAPDAPVVDTKPPAVPQAVKTPQQPPATTVGQGGFAMGIAPPAAGLEPSRGTRSWLAARSNLEGPLPDPGQSRKRHGLADRPGPLADRSGAAPRPAASASRGPASEKDHEHALDEVPIARMAQTRGIGVAPPNVHDIPGAAIPDGAPRVTEVQAPAAPMPQVADTDDSDAGEQRSTTESPARPVVRTLPDRSASEPDEPPRIGTPATRLIDGAGESRLPGSEAAALPTVVAPTDPAAAGSGADSAPDEVRTDPAASNGQIGPALDRNAEAFENPQDRPIMAIVLYDTGQELDSGRVGLDALSQFPNPLSFAVDVSLPDAEARAARYRTLGYEVLALIDLPENASPADTEVAFEQYLDRLPQALAVMEGAGSGLRGNRAQSAQVAAILSDTGHGIVWQPGGLQSGERLAARHGVASGTLAANSGTAGESALEVSRSLDRAAFRAAQGEAVIFSAPLEEDTISALLMWSLQDRASRVAVAPVSAVLLSERPE